MRIETPESNQTLIKVGAGFLFWVDPATSAIPLLLFAVLLLCLQSFDSKSVYLCLLQFGRLQKIQLCPSETLAQLFGLPAYITSK